MKVGYGILTVFLIFGFLNVSTCVFAEQPEFTASNYISGYTTTISPQENILTPQIKGGGGKSGSSSKSTKVKSDDDPADNSTDDGSSSSMWLWIVGAVIGVIVVIGVVFLFLRRR